MLNSPGSRPQFACTESASSEFASPKLALVESVSASPPSTWRPLSEIVSGIVREVQLKSAAEARVSDLPKAA
jgi:hypothetical protein